MLEVRLGVAVDEHAGVEHAGGVEEELDLAHHVVQFVAELRANIGSHHPAGAVLGLERSAFAEDQFHEVLGERAEAGQSLGAAEVVGEHEVHVAVFGMAEDHAVFVLVLVEQPDEFHAGAGQRRDRHGDVLEEGVGALRTRAAHGGDDPLAQVPQLAADAGVGREIGRQGEPQPVDDPEAGLQQLGQPFGGVGVVLHQQRRVLLDDQVAHDVGSAGHLLPHLQ